MVWSILGSSKRGTTAILLLSLVIISLVPTPCKSGANYTEILALFEEKLGSTNYNPDIRPVRDVETITQVTISVSLASVLKVDDIAQTITISGDFVFSWKDELLQWDNEKYKNLNTFELHPKMIWRPKMAILNSVEDLDQFEDSVCTTLAFPDGSITWSPPMQLSTYCQLNMDKFPFDSHRCPIKVCPINHFSDSIRLNAKSNSPWLEYYEQNNAWELVDAEVYIIDVPMKDLNINISCSHVVLELKRRPTYFVINIIMPVVMLSFLNVFVFVIPNESGEKISYGITVLLALALFLSMIRSLMPRETDKVPALTVYLFSILVASVFSVVMSIAIVALHHRDKKKQKRLKKMTGLQDPLKKEKDSQDTNRYRKNKVGDEGSATSPRSEKFRKETPGNCSNVVIKHINVASFVVFMTQWIIGTVWFFVYVNM